MSEMESVDEILDRYDGYKERVEYERQYPDSETRDDIVVALTRLMDRREIVGRIDELKNLPSECGTVGSDRGEAVTLEDIRERIEVLTAPTTDDTATDGGE